MLRIFTDFNARTSDDACWILKYNDSDLGELVSKLDLHEGDRIILVQDEGDFEVIASLDYRFIDILSRNAWVAVPDWSTIKRK